MPEGEYSVELNCRDEARCRGARLQDVTFQGRRLEPGRDGTYSFTLPPARRGWTPTEVLITALVVDPAATGPVGERPSVGDARVPDPGSQGETREQYPGWYGGLDLGIDTAPAGPVTERPSVGDARVSEPGNAGEARANGSQAVSISVRKPPHQDLVAAADPDGQGRFTLRARLEAGDYVLGPDCGEGRACPGVRLEGVTFQGRRLEPGPDGTYAFRLADFTEVLITGVAVTSPGSAGERPSVGDTRLPEPAGPRSLQPTAPRG